MDNMIYILFISIFVPILLMALLVEKRSRLPITFMLIGIVMSVFASEVNGLLNNLLKMDLYQLTVTVTPIVEEILKALPLLYYAIMISDKRETLFTASMAIGIGFGVLENAYYLLNSSAFGMVSALLRAFGAGLMHGNIPAWSKIYMPDGRHPNDKGYEILAKRLSAFLKSL